MDGNRINITGTYVNIVLEAVAILPPEMFKTLQRKKHSDKVNRYSLEEKDILVRYDTGKIHIRPLNERANSINVKRLSELEGIEFEDFYCDGSMTFNVMKNFYHVYTSPANE